MRVLGGLLHPCPKGQGFQKKKVRIDDRVDKELTIESKLGV